MNRPTLLGVARRMPGPIGTLARLPKPALVLVVAAFFGGVVGALVAHAVLAVWVYRDARDREFPRPDTWALATLVGGVFVFGPYLLLRRVLAWIDGEGRDADGTSDSSGRASDRREETAGRAADTARTIVRALHWLRSFTR